MEFKEQTDQYAAKPPSASLFSKSNVAVEQTALKSVTSLLHRLLATIDPLVRESCRL
jgi:hypothetical protein